MLGRSFTSREVTTDTDAGASITFSGARDAVVITSSSCDGTSLRVRFAVATKPVLTATFSRLAAL
jgi:hypothetical protein